MSEAKKTPKPPKPVAEGVPVDRAWQAGRRLYVRCGYQSQLNTRLREIGAKWDREVRALWVGSTKRDQVVELVRAAEERGAALEAVKAQGRWVRIPFEAEDIRTRAKELNALFDKPRREWAARSDEDLAELEGLVQARAERLRAESEERAARDKAQRKAAAEAERQADADAAAWMVARVLAESGRTTTGETAQLRIVSTRFMNRATAEGMTHPIGTVLQLRDGRRGIVTGAEVWFTNSEMASSVCWHPQTHDEAHWDLLHTLQVVEPTDEERAADARAAAQARDARAVHELVSSAAELTGAVAEDRHTAIPDQDVEGEIQVRTGSTGALRDGRLVLTRDGRVVWQHPGYYDSYILAEGITTDPDTVARVRAVLADGPRTREVNDGQMPTTYTITTPTPTPEEAEEAGTDDDAAG